MKIRFDHGPDGTSFGFFDPVKVIRADSPQDVDTAMAALDAAQKVGYWIAGFASYELGYALEAKLAARMPSQRRVPLMYFGVFEAPSDWALPSPAGALSTPDPEWTQAQYQERFAKVHGAIGTGDIYQANLTFPMTLNVHGETSGVYAALAERQPVSFGALVQMPGLPDILSRSPELFFRTDATGKIETRPMKGTITRHPDPVKDAQRKVWLAQDEKNCAENLMIVDLLRNDISRVSLPGSVKVPELFKVETYATVHQMVSLVQAQLKPKTTLPDILRALFPCGSVTGAPKIRAMEILSELEPAARDIYCGSIGWMAPNGSSEFNVAIRTLLVEDGAATLNVGGGVVWDSTAQAEYEEALWKARFAQLSPSFA